MKALLTKTFLILAGVLFINHSHATVITVSVMNFSFTPASFNASVGDTVKWVWVGGSHTTTSTSVPAQAATWSNPMNSSSTTFEYVITTPGTYNYWCAIHTTMMEANFTVIATGIAPIADVSQPIATIFPNPANMILNVRLAAYPKSNELVITDELGREVDRETLTNMTNVINIANWKKGVYLYLLKCDYKTMEGKFEVN